ncbi:MAG: hypothetical protein ACYCX7_10850 [Solirubrobacteraceae bacterium]
MSAAPEPAGPPEATFAAGAPAVASPAAGVPQGFPPALEEPCPLCGVEIDPAQDWCLRCGAAARTRLAATPKWWLPVAAIGTLALVSLCVLVAALVKLAA